MKKGTGKIMLDLKNAIKHLYVLPLIFGRVPPLFQKNSEINMASYDNIVDVTKAATNAIIGVSDGFMDDSTIDTNDITVFFLNGICTDKRVWEVNAKEIEEVFNFKVLPLHNTTNGVISDIMECVFGREFNLDDAETLHLYQTLKKALETNRKVIVLAHSQGGIIIAQLIQKLIEEEHQFLHKLELYTFASAASEVPIANYHAEHYANNYDYVSRIGVLSYRHDFHGKVFERTDGAGHLFNIHYLKPFREGLFCAGRSKLSKYLKDKYRYKIYRTEQ